MRIRKRPPPPPPQIPLHPSPQFQASHEREESSDERARRVQLKGDLSKDLHGWGRRRDPITTHPHPPTRITCPPPHLNGCYSPPLNATDHMKVLKEEKDLHEKTWDDVKVDSNYKRNPVTTYGGEGDDEKPMRKAFKLGAVAATALPKRTSSNGIDENAEGKKRRSPAVTTEGSRCSRVNGRGWRCSQQTMVGYALCEHHLGKGRLRSVRGLQGGAGGSSKLQVVEEEERTVAEMGKKVTGLVKARSMSSLINESSRVPTVDDYNASGEIDRYYLS